MKVYSKDLPLLLEFEKGLIEYEREFTPNLKKSSFNYYDLRAYIENPCSNESIFRKAHC